MRYVMGSDANIVHRDELGAALDDEARRAIRAERTHSSRYSRRQQEIRTWLVLRYARGKAPKSA